MSGITKIVKEASLAYVARYRNVRYLKNLSEMLAPFPGHGINFKVWQNDWPAGEYFIVRRALYQNYKKAEFYGLWFKNDSKVSQQLFQIKNPHSRGKWQFAVNGAEGLSESGMRFESWQLEKMVEFEASKQVKFQKLKQQ